LGLSLFLQNSLLPLIKKDMKNLNRLDVLLSVMEKAKESGFEYAFYPNFHLGTFIDRTNYYAVIFREDFAKSIWGEEEGFYSHDGIHMTGETLPKWKWMLRRLLEAEDKIKFLAENAI
jgi:hypothetical protein